MIEDNPLDKDECPYIYTIKKNKSITCNLQGYKLIIQGGYFMILITKAEADSIYLATALRKTIPQNNTCNGLLKAWQDDYTNVDKALLYAISCACAASDETMLHSEKHKLLSLALESLNFCIDNRSDWWIAQFLRIYILQISSSSSDAELPPDGLTEEACLELIKQQSESTKNEPYFFIPYLMAARECILRGDSDEAKNIIDKGFKEVELYALPFVINLFLLPFIDGTAILRRAELHDYADRVKDVVITLFPNSAKYFASL